MVLVACVVAVAVLAFLAGASAESHLAFFVRVGGSFTAGSARATFPLDVLIGSTAVGPPKSPRSCCFCSGLRTATKCSNIASGFRFLVPATLSPPAGADSEVPSPSSTAASRQAISNKEYYDRRESEGCMPGAARSSAGEPTMGAVAPAVASALLARVSHESRFPHIGTRKHVCTEHPHHFFYVALREQREWGRLPQGILDSCPNESLPFFHCSESRASTSYAEQQAACEQDQCTVCPDSERGDFPRPRLMRNSDHWP